jgi:hypothetical protein
VVCQRLVGSLAVFGEWEAVLDGIPPLNQDVLVVLVALSLCTIMYYCYKICAPARIFKFDPYNRY